MRGAGETPHARREPNLLVARFHSDLSLGRTEAFFVTSDWDEEGGATTSGRETNASFHPDGSSNTGSSPTSSDLMDVRARASSSSRAGGSAVLRPRQRMGSSKAAIHAAGKVKIGASPSSSVRTEFLKTSLKWPSESKSQDESRNKGDKEKELKSCKLPQGGGPLDGASM